MYAFDYIDFLVSLAASQNVLPITTYVYMLLQGKNKRKGRKNWVIIAVYSCERSDEVLKYSSVTPFKLPEFKKRYLL